MTALQAFELILWRAHEHKCGSIMCSMFNNRTCAMRFIVERNSFSLETELRAELPLGWWIEVVE